MKKTLWLAFALILTAIVAPPTLALPQDCSYLRCTITPGIVCAVPGTNRVVYCHQFLVDLGFAATPAQAQPMSADEFLNHLAAQPAEPAPLPGSLQVAVRCSTAGG